MPMKRTAIAMLALAIAIGGATVWLLRDFLESRASAAADPNAKLVQTTTVVVARQALNFGDTLRPELLKEVSWPSDSTPADSFENVKTLLDGTDRRVALRSIEPNEPILKQKISGFGGRATLSRVISENMRAVTIRVNDVIGVGGFILPGDKVDILLTHRDNNNEGENITDVLIQNVRVLAVDQTSDDRLDNPVVAKAATVEVTPEQAQKLSLATTIGSLTLTLRNVVNSEKTDLYSSRTIGVTDLTSDEDEGTTQFQSATSTVNLFRGTEENKNRVPRGAEEADTKSKDKPGEDKTSRSTPSSSAASL